MVQDVENIVYSSHNVNTSALVQSFNIYFFFCRGKKTKMIDFFIIFEFVAYDIEEHTYKRTFKLPVSDRVLYQNGVVRLLENDSCCRRTTFYTFTLASTDEPDSELVPTSSNVHAHL